jgi:hypothetical protein
MLKAFMTVLIAGLVAGCATSSKNLNKVSVGMTKAEVIQVLGQPESTRANRGVEFLIYSLREGISKPGTTIVPISIEGQYFVKLVDGRVESYGRVGDFDSTKPFETKHEIDLNVKEK